MKKLLLFINLLFLPIAAIAENSYLQRFQQANQLYEKGQFAAAIPMYESLVQEHQQNAALYYNLGNAYYRTQAMGKAIANYERALRLDPRDSEIRQNLAFLRQSVKEPDPAFLTAVARGLNGMVSINELTVICSVVYLLLIGLLTVYIFRRRQLALLLAILMALPVITLSGWLAFKYNDEVFTKWAVTIAGPVDVRNGPGMDNSVGFTLPEGRKLTILGEKDDWVAVGLTTEGLKGWMEKKYIEMI
jgi:tetratricopeptide (TPR) repeat protein